MTDLPHALVLDTAEQFGLTLDPRAVAGVLLSEERSPRADHARPAAARRLYPDGQLTEADYQYLRETHGLPRELVGDLAGR